jgi:hypothetical protein
MPVGRSAASTPRLFNKAACDLGQRALSFGRTALSWSPGGRDMVRQPLSGKAVANEKKYPYIVEFVVAGGPLDVQLSRRMMHFHSSRNIQTRYGRTIFSDSDTASAFKEQFGGEVLQSEW